LQQPFGLLLERALVVVIVSNSPSMTAGSTKPSFAAWKEADDASMSQIGPIWCANMS